jgi:CubicO group peptidase (beta-lactamase class C family)
MRYFILWATLCLPGWIRAQNTLYFPPFNGNWATLDPATQGFCQERIDSLYQFLADTDTKAFVLLKDGRIVLEHYVGTYTQDSFWYWASAGKSLTAFLAGMAKEEGILDLDAPTSTYLGNGWTTCPAEKELLITPRHQLKMTSGLDDNVPDDNCATPSCLTYIADAGTRWAYHNAAYRLIHDVIEEASGVSIQQYTKTRLADPIGMRGIWFNHIQYGRARDMARFGLLMLANGVWNGDTLLHDADYLYQMTHPSQDLNESYGYLWWLNGQNSFMVPSLQFVFNAPLIPNAPSDMYAALGKNDQKIHVVPSKGWVVVRQGNSGNPSPVPIVFDNELWSYLNQLECTSSSTAVNSLQPVRVLSTVSEQGWQLLGAEHAQFVRLLSSDGTLIETLDKNATIIPNAHLPTGIYLLQVAYERGSQTFKLIKP